MRRRKWKNTAGRQHRRKGDHAAADQVTVCWVFGCQLDSLLYTQTVDHTHIDFRIAQDLICAGTSGTKLLPYLGSVCKNLNYKACIECLEI